jgi:DNA-binding MarR family transcriptional regulator
MSKRENPYGELKQIFHEPNRLAIMSALCNSDKPLTFLELKLECNLTDGNLSRHLKALEESRAVRIRKSFAKGRPLTTISLTDRGREKFIEYLEALEEVLKRAAESLANQEKSGASLPLSLTKLIEA